MRTHSAEGEGFIKVVAAAVHAVDALHAINDCSYISMH
jgi:hypothetical protein